MQVTTQTQPPATLDQMEPKPKHQHQHIPSPHTAPVTASVPPPSQRQPYVFPMSSVSWNQQQQAQPQQPPQQQPLVPGTPIEAYAANYTPMDPGLVHGLEPFWNNNVYGPYVGVYDEDDDKFADTFGNQLPSQAFGT